jgi:hypothetical protein
MKKKRKLIPIFFTAMILLYCGFTTPAHSQVSMNVHFPTFVYHSGHFSAVLGNGYYPYYSYYPYYHPHYYHRYYRHYYGYSTYYRSYRHHNNGWHRGWYKHGNGHHGRR